MVHSPATLEAQTSLSFRLHSFEVSAMCEKLKLHLHVFEVELEKTIIFFLFTFSVLDRVHVCVITATDLHNLLCPTVYFTFRNRNCVLTFTIRTRKTVHLQERIKEISCVALKMLLFEF